MDAMLRCSKSAQSRMTSAASSVHHSPMILPCSHGHVIKERTFASSVQFASLLPFVLKDLRPADLASLKVRLYGSFPTLEEPQKQVPLKIRAKYV